MIKAMGYMFTLALLLTVMIAGAGSGCVSKTTKVAPPYSAVETKSDRYAEAHVMRVMFQDAEGEGGTGTGFAAYVPTTDGTKQRLVVVTAAHVCQKAVKMGLQFRRRMFYTEILGISSKVDVCFLTLNRQMLIKDGYMLEQPDNLKGISLSYGYPLNIDLIRFKLEQDGTIVTPFPSQDQTVRYLWLSGSVYPGQSGGPIVNPRTNRVIGIVAATNMVTHEEGYAVLASQVLSEAAKLVAPEL